MKAIIYIKPGLAIWNINEPENYSNDYVKIKVAYVGICGTDAHIAEGHFDHMVPFPMPIGHETSGVIVELGKKARIKGLKVGDKVAYYFNKYCGKCYVFECFDAISTIQSSIGYVHAGRTVVYVAMYGDAAAQVNLWNLFNKEITITAPPQSPYVWERTLNVLPDLNLDIFTQYVSLWNSVKKYLKHKKQQNTLKLL